MAASKSDIREWLNRPHIGKTYMIVVCDTFDFEDYPVFVGVDEDIEDVIRRYSQNMQKVMEVYDLAKDIEIQLDEGRVWNIK